jgi:hypothetical protein
MVKLCAAEATLRACVAKVIEPGFGVANGPKALPVKGIEPDKLAAAVTLRFAFRVPTVLGSKVREIVQVAPEVKVVPQVVDDTANSDASVVPMTMLVNEILPLFVSVALCATLVVPRLWPAKVRPAAGVSVALAPNPVPETGIF